MIVPESWGHGVLNLQESVAMATEAKLAHWRMPGSHIVHDLPFDNRKDAIRRGEKDVRLASDKQN